MSVSSDKSSDGPVTVFPNNDRRRTCEDKSCKRPADLNVKLGSPPSGKGHYWCTEEHWIQARSVLITRKITIRYAKGAIGRIFKRLQPTTQRQQTGCTELSNHELISSRRADSPSSVPGIRYPRKTHSGAFPEMEGPEEIAQEPPLLDRAGGDPSPPDLPHIHHGAPPRSSADS
jgi:hypothetical protein